MDAINLCASHQGEDTSESAVDSLIVCLCRCYVRLPFQGHRDQQTESARKTAAIFLFSEYFSIITIQSFHRALKTWSENTGGEVYYYD